MIHFYDSILLGGVFCSVICSIILLRSKYEIFTNRLLGLILFFTAWYVLLFLLVSFGSTITEFPYAFKITAHFYFLVPPLSYIYVRSTIRRETSFRRTDWLHFVLAGLIFFDYIPYLFASAENVKRLADAVVLDMKTTYRADATFVSPSWYYHIRSVQGIIYIVLQGLMVGKGVLQNKHSSKPVLRSVITWLVLFTVLGSCLYVGLQSRNIAFILNVKIDTPAFSIWMISFCFFCLSVYLLFHPRLLYVNYYRNWEPEDRKAESFESLSPDSSPIYEGFELVNEAQNDSHVIAKEQMSTQNLTAYALKIEKYMSERKVFLKQGISIHDLASELGIPARTLSYVLNHYYNQRFNDFINTYRVNYIIERFENGDWRNLTFEGLAKEAGFSSRSTFFLVFKKLKGLTPSEYLSQLDDYV